MVTAICWLDPGGTTGIAIWNWRESKFLSWQDDFIATGATLDTFGKLLRDELELGYESYAITPGAHVKHDGSSLRVIGMAEWLAHCHGVSMLPSQPPSARRVGLLHLKTAGWHRAGKVHANDAAAHLLSDGLRRGWLPDDLLDLLRKDMRDGGSGTES